MNTFEDDIVALTHLLSSFQHMDVSVLNVDPVEEITGHPVHQPCYHSACRRETKKINSKLSQKTAAEFHYSVFRQHN